MKYTLVIILSVIFLYFPLISLGEENEVKLDSVNKNNNIIVDPSVAKKNLRFRVNKSSLLIKDSSLIKKDKDIVEVSLIGEAYDVEKKINLVKKDNIDRTTIEGAVSSVFSANKSGDAEWIIDNFASDEKEKIRPVYENKKFIEGNKKFINEQTKQLIKAQTKYKEYTIVFIQQLKKDEQVTEALAFKKEGDQWKQTTTLFTDETFDVITSALIYGDVSIGYIVEAMLNPEAVSDNSNKNEKIENNNMDKKDSYIPKLF
jgi:hypothetical protein